MRDERRFGEDFGIPGWRRLAGRAALALLVLSAGGCSQFDIRSRHDPAADFARLHTYAWLPPSEAAPADQRVLNRYIDARIRRGTDTELGAKGYRAAGDEPPDFLLNYRLTTAPTSDFHGDPAYSFAGAGWWGWAGSERFWSETYDEGVLYLGVLDARTKRLVWVGAAAARLLPHLSMEKTEKRVDDAMHRIWEQFPPQ